MFTLLPAPNLILKQYKIIPYRIKFSKFIQTANTHHQFRQGYLIQLSTQCSLNAIGECAPMAIIGTESLAQAQCFLRTRLKQLIGQAIHPDLLLHMEDFPACRFALESAFLNLIAQSKRINIAQLLRLDYLQQEQNKTISIKVNSLLGGLNTDTFKAAKNAEKKGFQCLKIKMGCHDIQSESSYLLSLLKQISSKTLLRIDANKSWTIEQTEILLRQLQAYKTQIDSIEEPLKKFDHNAYQQLQKNTDIALALDESYKLQNSLDTLCTRRLVLKPMAQGGLLKCLALAQQAKPLNKEVVITSSFESAYGLWAISYLCAALNSPFHHGIATAYWLSDTLITAPRIQHGHIII